MRIHRLSLIVLEFLLCSLISAILLTNAGCGTGTMSTAISGKGEAMLTARVMGGRKPVSGSSITLYEAGTTGRGSAAAVLATATSDSNGNFNIDSFACLHTDSQLFITAAGGDAGNGVNSNILLIAMLGPCSNLPNNVVINELSTVAAAYTFAQFMNPQNPAQIGTGIPDTTQYIGMANAGSTLTTNVVNVATGTPAKVLGTSPNSPATLNSLADILVYCVNSPSPFTNCSSLYSAVTPPSGGSAPTNTLQAVLDIALSPGKNVATIYGLLSQLPVSAPFTPTLTTTPNDWLLALKFIPGDISVPRGMAIDQAGDIWIANAGTNSLTEISPLGVELSPSGGYKPTGLDSPEALFFDASGNLWVTNYSGNTVEAINSSESVIVPAFGSASYVHPTGIVTDSFNQTWAPNSGSENVTVSTTAGVVAFSVNSFGIANPTNVVADTTVTPNFVWISNSGTGGVSRLTVASAGSTGVTAGTSASGGGQSNQQGITLDMNGDVWVANEDASNGSVTKITGSTATVALGPLAVGGINSTSQPWGITTDTANNVWVNNFNNNSVTELDTNGNALSPAGGFTAGGLIKFPRNGIAVDRSGNVWVLDDDFPPPFVTELLGAASPVATPRSSGRPTAP